MITATWSWTDIRNFEKDASRYQRSQLAWALALAAALVLAVALFGLVASARVAQPFVKLAR